MPSRANPPIEGFFFTHANTSVSAVAKEAPIVSLGHFHCIALHPLAPLLRLLAHKCELATRALASPTSSTCNQTASASVGSPGALAAFQFTPPLQQSNTRVEEAPGVDRSRDTANNVLHLCGDAAQTIQMQPYYGGHLLTSSSSVDEDILHFARIVINSYML